MTSWWRTAPSPTDDAPPGATAPVALERVTSVLGGRRVLTDVSFAPAPGRITVLLGPSGSGKTVAIKHLVGLLQPTSGRALADGRDLRTLRRHEWVAFCDRMSIMFQGSTSAGCGLFGSMTALQNVAFPLRTRTGLDDREILALAREALGGMGLHRHAETLPEALSGGELRRVALARALVSRSPLLVVDDLEDGVDAVRLHGMICAVAEQQCALGSTVLVATNAPAVAHALAEDVVALRDGSVVERGGAELLDDPGAFAHRLMAGDTTCDLGARCLLVP